MFPSVQKWPGDYDRFSMKRREFLVASAAGALSASGLPGQMLGAGAGTPAIDQTKAKALLYRIGPEGFTDFSVLALAQAADPSVSAGWTEAADLAARWSAPSFPLSGGDLMDLGLGEGPELGELLEALERKWIDTGCLDDRAALLGRAQSMIKSRSK